MTESLLSVSILLQCLREAETVELEESPQDQCRKGTDTHQGKPGQWSLCALLPAKYEKWKPPGLRTKGFRSTMWLFDVDERPLQFSFTSELEISSFSIGLPDSGGKGPKTQGIV